MTATGTAQVITCIFSDFSHRDSTLPLALRMLALPWCYRRLSLRLLFCPISRLKSRWYQSGSSCQRTLLSYILLDHYAAPIFSLQHAGTARWSTYWDHCAKLSVCKHARILSLTERNGSAIIWLMEWAVIRESDERKVRLITMIILHVWLANLWTSVYL